jgi:hypothetical protein
MEEVARVITKVVDHARYDQCSEINHTEILDNPFQALKVDFRSRDSYPESNRVLADGMDHDTLQEPQGTTVAWGRND